MRCKTPTGDRQIPRNPEEYRYTEHFLDRRQERVPQHLIGEITDECIQNGTITEKKSDKSLSDDYIDEKEYRFERVIDGTKWEVIVGIRQDAFDSVMVKHNLVTIYNDE